MELTAWIPTAITVILGGGAFVGRHWIKAGIEKSIQHKFNAEIETLRAEFRKSEEEFKSNLRSKEMEISALRDGVLSGRLNRQALADKRRLEAVERVWTAVTELWPHKGVSASMAVINFDAAAKRAPQDPRLRSVFETIGGQMPEEFPQDLAQQERPFISLIAWALFSAYIAVLAYSHMRLTVLKLGIDDAAKLINDEHIKNLLKKALPHQDQYIDTIDSGIYHYLLDELEENLLVELKNMLEGKDIDEASIARSAEIMSAANNVWTDNAEQLSKASEA